MAVFESEIDCNEARAASPRLGALFVKQGHCYRDGEKQDDILCAMSTSRITKLVAKLELTSPTRGNLC